ncbi:SCAMP family protein, putative [Babesia ovata]|uniref:SCAMP family protein, putative n=1 Tax=Babesia ovata TaxID=189622 RepID=A0A2H6KHC7_9APIC|nr:SCAMP family protein, putative [Babesia ovata]GBE62379.1 SCAMP family protein, putative [Babesia ovata]
MGFGLVSKLSRLAVSRWFKKEEATITTAESDTASEENNENGEANQVQSIDWNDLNYPWGLNLVHYNRNELEDASAKVSRISHIGTFLVYGTLLLNLVDVMILASMGAYPMRILYSFFDIILLAPVVCANFYLTFVTLATKNKSYLAFCTGAHILMCLLYLTLAIVGEGPINGFTKFTHLKSEIAGCAGRSYLKRLDMRNSS